MSTKSRELIWGGRIMGAEIRAQDARETAEKAAREADAWSIRIEGYGGPAQPSRTIGQCLNGGLGSMRRAVTFEFDDRMQNNVRVSTVMRANIVVICSHQAKLPYLSSTKEKGRDQDGHPNQHEHYENGVTVHPTTA